MALKDTSINKVKMADVVDQSFLQYAGAILQSRALVDVRDCLKPSARQIFYCLYTDKFLPNKPFKKTLKAIGSIARLYIHGDSSAEGIIMRAGQPFAMRYPLVEVEGNNGNLIKSGNWAAPRYTAARLSPFAVKFFEDVDKDTIDDWRDNYDDTEKYPSVLPSKGFYNIVNGTFGLGIGAASSIPQFNIKDINKALETLLLNPNAGFEEIYCCPDFATGAFLINEAEVKEALKNGSGGSCKLRSKIDFDEKDNCYIVKEIPYGVYTETICKELEALLESEENPGIDKFNDLTGEEPLIKIYLSKNANKTKVLSYLYKNTSLQSFYGINLTMLDGGHYPKTFTWKEALSAHIEHEKEVYKKGYLFDLTKIKSKIHILDGLLICLASIDEVIDTIKTSSSTADAKEKLKEKFLVDEEQSTAILNMRLSRIAKLEVEKIKKEKSELEIQKKEIEDILADKNKFNQELIKEWRRLSNTYGDGRRTKVITVDEIVENIELPPAEPTVVSINTNNGIFRTPTKSISPQRRNGKGIKNKVDSTLCVIPTDTSDALILFSNLGQMYKLPVYLINDTMTAVNINTLIEIAEDEKIIAAASFNKSKNKEHIIFFTKQGMLKKSSLSEYTKTKKGKGLIAIKLKDGDSIANAIFINDEPVTIFTKKGNAIKFETNNIAAIGRNTTGVKALKLEEDDEVVKGLPVTEEYLLVTEKGYGKRLNAKEDLPIKTRGTKNVSVYKITPTVGNVADVVNVQENDCIMVTGTNSLSCKVNEIPVMSKVSSGVALIKNSKVTSVSNLTAANMI